MQNNILVTRPSLPEIEEYINEIKGLWDSHWLTNMGEKHELLEMYLKEYLQTPYISLTVNGHMALENIIKALELQGEIITTPFTFASTTHAIVRCGCTPVFCDINPIDYTIDADKIEELITDDTVAIMPVHVYGNICNTDKIAKIAKEHDLYVLYDAAHAFGETWHGKSVAQFGDASIFSFHATKVFHTIEGGCITFSDKVMENVLKDIKNFGFNGCECVRYPGGNAKLNEFQAAMGICNLRHIQEEIQKRKEIYECYATLLEDVEGLKIWHPQLGVEHNYAYFPVFFEPKFGIKRDEVMACLAEKHIYTRKYFYPITADFQCYNRYFNKYSLNIARDSASRVLTLPMYADLGIENVERICEVLKSIQKEGLTHRKCDYEESEV